MENKLKKLDILQVERWLVSIVFPKSNNPKMTYGKIIEFMVTFSATIGITLCISKLFTRFFLRCMDPFESYFGIFSLIGLYYLVYAIQRTLWNYFILKSKKH